MSRKHLIFVLLLMVLVAGLASACPLCKDTAATATNDLHQSGAASLGGGFNRSIYFMFAGLFAAMSIVAFNLTKAIRGK